MPLKRSLRRLSLQNSNKMRLSTQGDGLSSEKVGFKKKADGKTYESGISRIIESKATIPKGCRNRKISTPVMRSPAMVGSYVDSSGDELTTTPPSTPPPEDDKISTPRPSTIGHRKTSSCDDTFELAVSPTSTSSDYCDRPARLERRRLYSSGDELCNSPSPTYSQKDPFQTRSLTRNERLLNSHGSSSEGWKTSTGRSSASRCDCADSALYELILGACAIMAFENAELKKRLDDKNESTVPKDKDVTKRGFSMLRKRRQSLPSLKIKEEKVRNHNYNFHIHVNKLMIYKAITILYRKPDLNRQIDNFVKPRKFFAIEVST